MPLYIIRRDITRMACDAIVTTVDRALCPVGRTAATVHRLAGEAMGEELRAAQKTVGETVVTSAHRLVCRHILHTLTPEEREGDEEGRLAACYREAVTAAVGLGCESLAIPLVSLTALPRDRVLALALETLRSLPDEGELTVYLVMPDRSSYRLDEARTREVAAYLGEHYQPPRRPDNSGVLYRRIIRKDTEEDDGEDACLPCPPPRRKRGASLPPPLPPVAVSATKQCRAAEEETELEALLKGVRDNSFALTLFRLIDERGMSDVECYKAANVDKKTFSKIKCNEGYRPSKQTVIAFAIALKLTLDETQALLATVGLTLSRSSRFDVIVEYFIRKGNYDMLEINETLFEFDQVLLGCL